VDVYANMYTYPLHHIRGQTSGGWSVQTQPPHMQSLPLGDLPLTSPKQLPNQQAPGHHLTTLHALPSRKTSNHHLSVMDNPKQAAYPYIVVSNRIGSWIILSPIERFVLVSSLYGPGNVACWYLLIFSVLVSWTVNPSSRQNDSITNDFIAVLTLPAVAVGHFFYMAFFGTKADGGLKGLLESREEQHVISVGALEAPLTVSEDFILWAIVLFSVAASSGHRRRRILVACVGLLCLAPQLLLRLQWVPYELSALYRPFLFHVEEFSFLLLLWLILSILLYIAAVFLAVCVAAAGGLGMLGVDPERGDSIRSGRRLWSPRWLTSRMSACLAAGVAAASIHAKYGVLPLNHNISVRFVPRSSVGVMDLDQAIAALGGLIALGFSLKEAIRERKSWKRREKLLEMRQRWGR